MSEGIKFSQVETSSSKRRRRRKRRGGSRLVFDLPEDSVSSVAQVDFHTNTLKLYKLYRNSV